MFRDLWLVITGKLSSERLYDAQEAIETQRADYHQLMRDERLYHAKRIEPLILALGRLIATDKAFVTDELDPKRKAESDKLADKAISRLMADDWARKHTVGEA